MLDGGDSGREEGLTNFVVAAGCEGARGCRNGGGRRDDLAVCAGVCWARGHDKIGLRWSDVFLHHSVFGERGWREGKGDPEGAVPCLLPVVEVSIGCGWGQRENVMGGYRDHLWPCKTRRCPKRDVQR